MGARPQRRRREVDENCPSNNVLRHPKLKDSVPGVSRGNERTVRSNEDTAARRLRPPIDWALDRSFNFAVQTADHGLILASSLATIVAVRTAKSST